jgi:HSP20 family protein
MERSREASGGRDGGRGTAETPVQKLPVTIWETDDAFYAALLAPALVENSINVTLKEDMLTIEGELRLETPERARMIWQEFAPTRFQRTIRVGKPIDREHVEAVYRNGLLLITMPKAETARPHQVPVHVAEGSEQSQPA